MRKKIISVAFLSAAISVTMIATSCSDDINEPKNTTKTIQSTANADKVFFMYGVTDSQNLGVKFDGSKAAILKCANADGARNAEDNAEITYTNDSKTEGYFTMNDNFLGAKKINFIITDGIISLDFGESKNAYNGGKVFLDQQGTNSYDMTRGTSGDTRPNDVVCTKVVNAGKKMTCKLLTMGAKALLGDFGDAVFSPLFETVLGTTGSNSELKEQYEMIQNSIDRLSNQLSETQKTITVNNVTDKYREYWFEIKQRRSNNKEVISRIALDPKKKTELLKEWSNAKIGGNDNYSGPMTRIEYFMEPYSDGRLNMNIIDEYIFFSHNWESEGYAERDLMRMNELITFTESLMIYKEYKQSIGSTNFSDIEQCLDKYLKFYKEHYYYKKHYDKAVCQIDGAYFVTPIYNNKDYTRCIGQAQFTSNGTNGSIKALTVIANVYYQREDGPWKYTYVFSDKKMSVDDNEVTAPYKDKCLKKSELEAIVKHSNNRNVFDILRKEAGMARLTDDPILLQDRLYVDWIHYQAPAFQDSEFKMMGSVWEKNGNKYNENYELDDAVLKNDVVKNLISTHDRTFKSHSDKKKVNDIQVERKSYNEMAKFQRELMTAQEVERSFQIDLETSSNK